MKKIRYLTGVLLIATFTISCGWSNMARGGVIGAGLGGALGGAIGNRTGNTAAGAIIGAAVGGTAGAAIGNYMDRQAEEMRRDLDGAKVERIGEGIKITFDSGILFDIGSDALKPQARNNVNDLALILQKYEDTNILVEGHTDSTGSAQLNQRLSEDRAASVARQLKSRGVVGRRVTTLGFGQDQPIADNGTAAGRQQNRRVEVAIFANDKLKRAAERGQI
ncbi:OmpA family protein [Chitinispirillales bacterium ANBcel5]|uniref:OmpA family protein n=1 Tax=Cellulosispirillum alkaliphilum TaxID=3039283 RepID=UPI002A53D5F4|nr:OmpA family protein [Chitinispirillales bacterium ANBcel5]